MMEEAPPKQSTLPTLFFDDRMKKIAGWLDIEAPQNG
jgi:hypothetical protein